MAKLYSIGDLMRECGCQLHRIRYVLRVLSIEPLHRIGNVRVYDERALNQVRAKIREIAGRRELAGADK